MCRVAPRAATPDAPSLPFSRGSLRLEPLGDSDVTPRRRRIARTLVGLGQDAHRQWIETARNPHRALRRDDRFDRRANAVTHAHAGEPEQWTRVVRMERGPTFELGDDCRALT